MATATAERASKRVTKKKLTVTQAADQWENAKRKMDELKPELEEAAGVLKEYFERTGRHTYKDRIAYSTSTRLVLVQAKVREFLGARLAEFQERAPVKSLTLLK